MITGIHLLLSYTCNFECDHCFVYGGPSAKGTFTMRQIDRVLKQARELGCVEWIYFEGGEPCMFYPLMLEGARRARAMGFEVGVVTNAYFATSEDDARLWLQPLADLGIGDLSISDDAYHYGEAEDTPPKRALACARELSMPVGSICIEEPFVTGGGEQDHAAGAGERGAPIVGGDVVFRGRAVEKLIGNLPRQTWRSFAECPHEDLRSPARVHLDCYGNVQLCQGICMGNVWETDLARIVGGYDPDAHPICGPLLKGGPAALAESYQLNRSEGYVDACHLCYDMRIRLLDRFPRLLAPRQVYGLK